MELTRQVESLLRGNDQRSLLAGLPIPAGALADAVRERDELRRHYDAAGPEHNLLALLDLYLDRQLVAERERDEARKEVRQIAESCGAIHEQSMGATYAGTVAEIIGRINAMKDQAAAEERAKIVAFLKREADDWVHETRHLSKGFV